MNPIETYERALSAQRMKESASLFTGSLCRGQEIALLLTLWENADTYRKKLNAELKDAVPSDDLLNGKGE
jgi:hypothetical protein